MNNYWIEREHKHIEKQLKNDEKIARVIKRKHTEAMREIQEQIDAFYARYAGKEGITMTEARRRATKLDIERYAKKAKRYVSERNFTDMANEEMRIYNLSMRVSRLELLKLNIELELVSMTSEVEHFLYEKFTEGARAELARQSGILGETIVMSNTAIDKVVNASFHNATWSENIWDNQHALRTELDRVIHRGIIQGKHSRVLAREIRKKFGTSVYNSERLMRTEMARVQQDVFQESMKKAGILRYVYIAEPTACEICAALDGKDFAVEDAQSGVNAYPMHPHCRCSQAAYIE